MSYLPFISGHWASNILERNLQPASFPSARCPGVSCPASLCADPQYLAEDCCPSCKMSKCQFKGCVDTFGMLGTSWIPNPCKTCYCIRGNPYCVRTRCPPLPCALHQIVRPTDRCCPYCDSNIAKHKCSVVDDCTVNITITDNSLHHSSGEVGTDVDLLIHKESCRTQVVKHRCDKVFFYENNRRFHCWPQQETLTKAVTSTCSLKQARIAYRDVTSCVSKATRKYTIQAGAIPQLHCDFFVPTN